VIDILKRWVYTVRYLKWVLHHLSTAMMEQRVKLSRKLLVSLKSVKHRGWTYFLTEDESWFWMTTDYEQQWLPPGAERPIRLQKMIGPPEAIIIIS
jgi:hypothetical protein